MKNDRQLVDDQFLDKLLDATLERARGAEPRPGLEGRVMARLRAERAAQSPFTWTWRLVAGLAALVVVAMTLRMLMRYGSTPRPRGTAPSLVSQSHGPEAASPPASTVVSRPAAPNSAAPPQPAGRAHRRSAPRHERRVRWERGSVHLASAEPKQFPSPSPLSEEERLLLRAKDAPPSVLVAWGGNDVAGNLQIRDLDIPPLENWPPDSDSEQK